MNSKLVLALLLTSVVLVACGGSSGPYSVWDKTDVFNAFRSNANTGVCPITVTLDVRPDGINSVLTSNGFWPSAGLCGGLDGTVQGQPSSDLPNSNIVLSNSGTFNANKKAEVIGFQTGIIPPTQSNPQVRMTSTSKVITTAIDKNLYDVTKSGAFPIMNFAWCGETVDVEFDSTTTTLTPSKITFEGHSGAKSNACAALKAYSATGNHNQEFVSTARGVNNPFNLPLQQPCTNYTLKVDAVESSGDWPWTSTYAFQPSQGTPARPTQYRLFRSNKNEALCAKTNNHNSFEILLNLDSNQRLQSIDYTGCDYSGDYGGMAFTVICDGVVDADLFQNVCASNTDWQWSSAVNTSHPGEACCGDDTNDAGEIWDTNGGTAFYQCTKNPTTGKHTWNPYIINCYQGICCSSANESKVVYDGVDMAVCVNTGNAYRWANASSSTAIYNFTGGKSIASNGTDWLICGNTTSVIPHTLTYAGAPPAQGSTGSPNSGLLCTTATDCQQQLTECNAYCGSQWGNQCGFEGPQSQSCAYEISCMNACDDDALNCVNNGGSCDATIGLLCDSATSECLCQNYQVWNQTSGRCESPTANANLGSSNGSLGYGAICSSISNPVNPNLVSVCAGNWTRGNVTDIYFSPVAGTTPTQYRYPGVGATQYVCNNGQLDLLTLKWSPDRKNSKACAANECFYKGVDSFVDGKCVPSDTYVRDDFCQAGEWTTRTRLLANDLISTWSGDYVLHCDTVTETINDPSTPSKFAVPTPPHINSFCALQSPHDSDKVLVGASLNTLEGRTALLPPPLPNSPIVEAINRKSTISSLGTLSFASTMNWSLAPPNRTKGLEISASNCSEANYWPDVDQYDYCDTVSGMIAYNTHIDTVIFSTEGPIVRPTSRIAPLEANVPSSVSLQRPLSGYKLYSYRNSTNNKAVEGVLQAEGTGTSANPRATVVYKNIDITQHFNRRFASNSQAVLNCNAGTCVITLERPNQNDWEYLTLQVRP